MRFFKEMLNVKGTEVSLRGYLPDATPRAKYPDHRPAVIVFPGGGYAYTYPGEAEPIALQYLAAGACAFVLDYSCYPARFPQALLEGLTAIRYVRDHAEEFGVDPSNIAVCGFSAGGHLAACTGTLWDHEILNGELDGERELYRPDKLILCYPVVNSLHRGSLLNLFSQKEEDLTPERIELLSLENRVSKKTPPTFIWHNCDDPAVPVKGSLAFATALYENGVPFRLRVYGNGGHGVCLGSHVTTLVEYGNDMPCAAWMQDSIDFLFGRD